MRLPIHRTALFFVLLLPFQQVIAQYRLGEVLAPRVYTVTAGAPSQYEKLVTEMWYPFFTRESPGVDILLMKSDRGKWEGKYLDLWMFTTKALRDEWFPVEEGPAPRWDQLVERRNASVDSVLTSSFVFGGWDYPGDYVLLGRLEQMPEFVLLGLHHFKVKAGQEAAFEQFVAEKWNPTVTQQPVPRLFYMADRGVRKGQYLLVVAFPTVALRDKLWPDPGVDSEASIEAFRPFQEISNQAWAFMEQETPTQDEYSDFVLIE